MRYNARGLAFTTTAEAGPGTMRAAVPIPPSHHGYDLERWPLHSALTLAAVEGSVPSARAHARQLLCEWGQAEVSQDAGAVVTELVANAVVASAGLGPATAPVLVWLGSDGHCVLLTVADASPRPPVRLNLESDAEGGAGTGAGGSVQQSLGVASGQHRRASESRLGRMAPADRGRPPAEHQPARPRPCSLTSASSDHRWDWDRWRPRSCRSCGKPTAG